MTSTGNHRLAWQQGERALYADATVEIERDVHRGGMIQGVDAITQPWRVGVLFGLALAREALAGIVDFSGIVVVVTAFRGQPSDTTVTAAAFAAFHAVAKALNHPDLVGVFGFDESTGRFSIAFPTADQGV